MTAAPNTDPYLHLEEVDSPQALDWVTGRSERTVAELTVGEHPEAAHARALEILDAPDKIAWPVLRGEYAYTLWRDADHPRGLWRRAPWTVVRDGVPGVDDPAWELLVDVDALAAEEGVNWVYAGTVVRRPDDDRALIRLSRGGADAVELREFDLDARRFVPASEGGFRLPETKCSAMWVDADTLLLTAPLDPDGADATGSGYARLVRLWRRGTDPAEAPVIFSGRTDDVAVGASFDLTSERLLASRAPDFHTSQEWFWRPGDDPVVTRPRRIPVPADCRVDTGRDWVLLLPRTDLEVGGRTHPGGCVLAVPWTALDGDDRDDDDEGTVLPEPVVLFAPTASTSVEDVTWGRDRLLLTVLDEAESRLEAYRIPAPGGGTWDPLPVEGLPEHVTIDALSCDRLSDGGAEQPHPDAVTLAVSGPVVPPTLVLLQADGTTVTLGRTPHRFDTTGVEVSRHTARSEDGTQVPYTVMRGPLPDGADPTEPRPTILYGYGGFEIAMKPSYAALRGALWLEEGGVYVVAGIRGGGEYGPAWHRAAVREERPRAFEDFAAVARDLVATGVTTRDRLGSTGGSNGGLLMGVMLTRYPELFGALAIAVPLLDMKRYHLLLAGASWMAEYGDPDSSDWEEFLGAYSPYQHVASADEVRYPPVLMTTSTRDDRVHPGHARKMTAALEAAGHEVAYYENTEGGHAGAADNSQEARRAVLTYEFFRRRLRGSSS